MAAVSADQSVICKDGAYAVLFPVPGATADNLGCWLVMAIPEKGAAQSEPDYEVILVKDWRAALPQGDGTALPPLLDALRQGGAGLYPHAPIVAATTSRDQDELLVKYGPMSGPACTWGVQGGEAMLVIGALQNIERYLVGKYDNVTRKRCHANTTAPKRRTA
ncbi:hypothetical protein [Oecophyllibacter saccharovorans]|uniref:Uncharacterized protein n=1 Tax=Oecophyllibacter saccharovorans TaxID=2558360 RepID=A0A506UKL2_9PROT|nr:hypothetical protein [Oecophyllibacter saccharovorans]TPW33894.1 hypothetical protein E3202_04695 [Oecophyllibacter saccharovorans]